MASLKWLFLSILIASALFLSAASSGSGNKKHQNQTSTHDPTSKRQANQPTPSFTIVVQPAPVQIVQPSPAVEQNKPEQKWYQRPTITDWGIFVVTILYTAISLGLLNATRRQAKLADKSLRITQRAEVSLGRPDGVLMEVIHPQPGMPLVIRMFFYNSGRTAAQDFRHALNALSCQFPGNLEFKSLGGGRDYRPEPARKTVIVDGFPATVGWTTSTIGAGAVQTHIVVSQETLSGEEAESVVNGRAYIFVSGKFEYTDGFGKEEWRTYFASYSPAIGHFVATDGPFQGGRGPYPPYETDPHQK